MCASSYNQILILNNIKSNSVICHGRQSLKSSELNSREGPAQSLNAKALYSEGNITAEGKDIQDMPSFTTSVKPSHFSASAPI
jgi:hypothetical protein